MQKVMEIAGSEVWSVREMALRAQAAEFYDIGIQNFVPRLNKCLDKGGDYVEK
jgi:hypothetical protein